MAQCRARPGSPLFPALPPGAPTRRALLAARAAQGSLLRAAPPRFSTTPAWNLLSKTSPLSRPLRRRAVPFFISSPSDVSDRPSIRAAAWAPAVPGAWPALRMALSQAFSLPSGLCLRRSRYVLSENIPRIISHSPPVSHPLRPLQLVQPSPDWRPSPRLPVLYPRRSCCEYAGAEKFKLSFSFFSDLFGCRPGSAGWAVYVLGKVPHHSPERLRFPPPPAGH